MSPLHVAFVGFDITPRFHPTCGAWGSTPFMTELDQPLLARCIAFACDRQRLVWFGSDLVGDNVARTDEFRCQVADALNLQPDQVLWSTSQTHSSGAVPGGGTGSSVSDLSRQDTAFMAAERSRFIAAFVAAGRQALAEVRPASVWAGRGHCDSMSYNTRFPMPNGGNKFSRHHAEGLQSGKFFDPTIGLVRFDGDDGQPLGVIFNFCCHPATMINDRFVSPDWVGTARQHLEDALGGKPAMFVQGFCGDVNCHHIFGTPTLARRSGARLGRAAVAALPTLVPVRAAPFACMFRTIEIPCQAMPPRAVFEHELAARETFIEELQHDPTATWFLGVNLAEQLTPAQRTMMAEIQIRYLREGLRMIDSGETAPAALPITLGALRIGDVGAALSPGENFTRTGHEIRIRSPFAHTLVCGDTNGLFGYIGTDDEIDRGGYETDSFWKMLRRDRLLLPPAKGSAQRVVSTCVELLQAIAG